MQSCNLRILRQTTVITLVLLLPFQQHSDCFFHHRLDVMSLGYLCFVTRDIYLWFTRLFFRWLQQLISYIFNSNSLVSTSLWDLSRLLKSIVRDLSSLAVLALHVCHYLVQQSVTINELRLLILSLWIAWASCPSRLAWSLTLILNGAIVRLLLAVCSTLTLATISPVAVNLLQMNQSATT